MEEMVLQGPVCLFKNLAQNRYLDLDFWDAFLAVSSAVKTPGLCFVVGAK